ncbi:MAG: hypothetical protein H6650_08940 [Ardenticatenales bacterium]|nr:hypothetical protein [Ardenticatenales bacterium]
MSEGHKIPLVFLSFAAYVLGASATLAVLCRLNFAPLTLFAGFFWGWYALLKTYIVIKGRMSVTGDFLLFINTMAVFYLTRVLHGWLCTLNMGHAQCLPAQKTGCSFLLFMSMGIALVSLWLWFRFRQAKGEAVFH